VITSCRTHGEALRGCRHIERHLRRPGLLIEALDPPDRGPLPDAERARFIDARGVERDRIVMGGVFDPLEDFYVHRRTRR
jgi:hypothetical protein